MKRFLPIVCLCAALSPLCGGELPKALEIDGLGVLRIERARFGFTVFNSQWHPFGNDKLVEEKSERKDGGFSLSARLPINATDAEFTETVTPTAPGEFQLRYRLNFPAPFKGNGIRASLTIPNDLAAVTVDGKRIELPAQYGNTTVFAQKQVKTIVLDLAPGKRLTLYPGGAGLGITDSRAYQQDSFNLDFAFPQTDSAAEFSLRFRWEEAAMHPVSLAPAANRSFCDDSTGGGWTGQGPDNDLSSMRGGKVECAPFRFDVLPPKAGQNSAIVLGGAGRRLSGREAVLRLPEDAKAGAVNLLHAAAWLPLGKVPFGEIEVRYADGSFQTVPVVMYRDCGNWWGADDLPNAKVAWRSENPTSPLGLYASSFALARRDPREIRFRNTAEGETVWMIAAVTLSDIPALDNRNTAGDLTAAPTKEWPRLAFRDKPVAGSPLDFSRFLDAPAGKHGFVTATPEGRFSFENAPEKNIRFLGVNLCFSGNFLAKEEADKLAETLAWNGYNSVRFHHIDSELLDWNSPESCALRADRLDQLDYLLAALKKRGIYVTTDLYSLRTFRKADQVEAKGGEKSLFPIDAAAMESWKRYARKLLTHVNPYTGLAWKDDPALCVICLVNEGTLYANWGGAKEAYAAAFEAWKKANGRPEARAINTDRNFLRFLQELETKAFEVQRNFLRDELKCRTLLTNWNMGAQENFIALSRDRLDVVDNHVYFAHPSFPEKMWALPTAYSQNSIIREMASCPNYIMASRIFGKPFLITEYNFCLPNHSRSAGGPVMGAYAALQDWGGFYRFAWGHHSKRVTVNQTAVGFDMAKDPLAWLSDRIAFALFVRGDAEPAAEKFAYGVSPGLLESGEPLAYPGWIRRLGLIAQVGTEVAKDIPGVLRLNDRQFASPADFPDKTVGAAWADACDPDKKYARSATGQITLDGERGTFTVVTPRTESLSLEKGALSGKVLGIRNADTFTTAAAISLDGEPLAESRSILILHLTDTTVEGCTFNNTRTLHKAGVTGPLLRKQGRAEIELVSTAPFRVTPLSVDGDALAPLEGVLKKGRFSFRADTGCRSEGVFSYHLTR